MLSVLLVTPPRDQRAAAFPSSLSARAPRRAAAAGGGRRKPAAAARWKPTCLGEWSRGCAAVREDGGKRRHARYGGR